jgi:hypothetical protein
LPQPTKQDLTVKVRDNRNDEEHDGVVMIQES